MDITQPNNTFQQKITLFLERMPVIYQFLRFACIGMLNTGLNFLILNSLSKFLHISQGWSLGAVSVLAFCAAVVQSYLWNRTWTFGSETGVGIWKNVVRLFLVGALGAFGVLIALGGSGFSAPALFFGAGLAIYLIFESALWKGFGFHMSDWNHEGHSFVVFFIVTLIGLGINFLIISYVSSAVHLTGIIDLNKNIAAVIATAVSLFWNFTGYKLIVFKK